MKKLTQKISLCLLACLFLLGACGGGTGGKNATTVFTDDIGREVEIPTKIDKIIPSGSVAQTIIFSLAPDKMIGVSSTFTDNQKKYIDPKYHNLPEFGQFYGKNVSMNKEEIIAANPDIIIDFGQVKKTMVDDLNSLQEDLGIPVIFIEANIDTTASAYEKLGTILGMEKEAKPFVDYLNETLKIATDAKAKITEPISVYYGEQESGLQTSPIGSMHAEVLEVVGAQNVAPESFGGGKSSGEANLEEIVAWNPAYAVFGPEVDTTKIMNDPVWQSVDAIKNGNVSRVVAEPLHWLGRPPGVNRFMGIRWLGQTLYPESYNLDLEQDMIDFYLLFYNYDMTNDEAKALLQSTEIK